MKFELHNKASLPLTTIFQPFNGNLKLPFRGHSYQLELIGENILPLRWYFISLSFFNGINQTNNN